MKISEAVNFFNNRNAFLLLFAVVLTLALLPYYTNGSLILGGEGNYVLDFSTHFKNFAFSWQSHFGTGLPNMGSCSTALNILILMLVENLTGSAQIANFLLIFSIYFFPFLGMHLVCKELKIEAFISFLVSLFYLVNPFMLYYLICLNQWSIFSIAVMPLFFWITLKYYTDNFKLFFCFGFISACFSFTYANPPMLIIVHVSIFLTTVIASYCKNNKIIFSQILKKWGIVFSSFILFNFWWILSFLVGAFAQAQKTYTLSFAQSWLDVTRENYSALIAKMFVLTAIIGTQSSYDFFTWWFNSVLAKLITIVPIFIIVYFGLFNKRTRNLFNYAMTGVLLAILFFAKGNADPFGFVYNFLFRYLPFFYIFKSPVAKFGLLYVFIFSLLLLFVLSSIKNEKYYKSVLNIFIGYLLFCSVPIFTGNIIPDFNLGNSTYGSRKYTDKAGYRQVREGINNDKYLYKILSLPGRGNYQICMSNHSNKKYTGLDPILMNVNKPFIAPQNKIPSLYTQISSMNYKKILGIFNIGKIVINSDLLPWFGTVGIANVKELKEIFSKYMTSETFGAITIYKNKENFLPKIYASENLTIVNGDLASLIPMMDMRCLDRKPVILFAEQMPIDINAPATVVAYIFEQNEGMFYTGKR